MRWAMLAAALAGAAIGASGQPAPLPDLETFFAQARARAADTRLEENDLAYRERSTELLLNPVGRMGTGPIVVAEIFPFPAYDLTYRRVIERAGRAVPAPDLAAQDRRFLARLAGVRRDTPADRVRRAAEARAREAAIQRDAFDALVFTVEDRVEWQGQPAIRVRFTPRPGANPRTREGRVVAGFAGMAWIHEFEFEVMQVVADIVDDVSFGFGVIGRLHRGSRFETRRARVNGVWVTYETVFQGTARALMFRHVELNFRREYFDYRPIDPARVETMLQGH